MVLQLSPDAPLWLRLAADLALVLHIAGGLVGIAAGALALMVPKGGRWHRIIGDVFVGAMLIMAGIGAYVSIPMHTPGNVAGGVMALYLVTTGWLAVLRRGKVLGALNAAASLVVAGVVAAETALGLVALHSPGGTLDGLPAPPFFIVASVAALATTLDLSVFLRGGVVGAQRIARHLWRMTTGLLMAVASLFLGQPQVFPKALQGGLVLYLPVFAVIGALVYWLCRVLLSRKPAPQRREAYMQQAA
jgi:uncharacterized membrane protein